MTFVLLPAGTQFRLEPWVIVDPIIKQLHEAVTTQQTKLDVLVRAAAGNDARSQQLQTITSEIASLQSRLTSAVTVNDADVKEFKNEFTKLSSSVALVQQAMASDNSLSQQLQTQIQGLDDRLRQLDVNSTERLQEALNLQMERIRTLSENQSNATKREELNKLQERVTQLQLQLQQSDVNTEQMKSAFDFVNREVLRVQSETQSNLNSAIAESLHALELKINAQQLTEHKQIEDLHTQITQQLSAEQLEALVLRIIHEREDKQKEQELDKQLGRIEHKINSVEDETLKAKFLTRLVKVKNVTTPNKDGTFDGFESAEFSSNEILTLAQRLERTMQLQADVEQALTNQSTEAQEKRNREEQAKLDELARVQAIQSYNDGLVEVNVQLAQLKRTISTWPTIDSVRFDTLCGNAKTYGIECNEDRRSLVNVIASRITETKDAASVIGVDFSPLDVEASKDQVDESRRTYEARKFKLESHLEALKNAHAEYESDLLELRREIEQKQSELLQTVARTAEQIRQAAVQRNAMKNLNMIRITVRIRCSSGRDRPFFNGNLNKKGGVVFSNPLPTTIPLPSAWESLATADQFAVCTRKQTNASNVCVTRSSNTMRVMNDDYMVEAGKCEDQASLRKRNEFFYNSFIHPMFYYPSPNNPSRFKALLHSDKEEDANVDVDPEDAKKPGVLSIVAYGQSGSGKTTTLSSVRDTYIQKRIAGTTAGTLQFVFFEIYQTIDLAEVTKKAEDGELKRKKKNSIPKPIQLEERCLEQKLRVYQGNSEWKNVTLPQTNFDSWVFEQQSFTNSGDKTQNITNSEFMEALDTSRQTRITPENFKGNGSSRSHMITVVYRTTHDRPQINMFLVDLAGSEDYTGYKKTKIKFQSDKINTHDKFFKYVNEATQTTLRDRLIKNISATYQYHYYLARQLESSKFPDANYTADNVHSFGKVADDFDKVEDFRAHARDVLSKEGYMDSAGQITLPSSPQTVVVQQLQHVFKSDMTSATWYSGLVNESHGINYSLGQFIAYVQAVQLQRIKQSMQTTSSDLESTEVPDHVFSDVYNQFSYNQQFHYISKKTHADAVKPFTLEKKPSLLVEFVHRLNVLGRAGMTTLLFTFKSSSDNERVDLAAKTIDMLECLAPLNEITEFLLTLKSRPAVAQLPVTESGGETGATAASLTAAVHRNKQIAERELITEDKVKAAKESVEPLLRRKCVPSSVGGANGDIQRGGVDVALKQHQERAHQLIQELRTHFSPTVAQ